MGIELRVHGIIPVLTTSRAARILDKDPRGFGASGFVNTEDLSADADEDAAEIAQLEAEIELTGVQAYEAWETRKTYEQIIKRLKHEATCRGIAEQLEPVRRADGHHYQRQFPRQSTCLVSRAREPDASHQVCCLGVCGALPVA